MRRALRWAALAIVLGAIALSVTDHWIGRIAAWIAMFAGVALWAKWRGKSADA